MNGTLTLAQAIRIALLGGGAITAGLMPHVVWAQQAPAPTIADATQSLQDVIVTGTRIAQPNIEAVSPVTTFSASEIRETGTTRIEDLLNGLSQVVGDQASGFGQGSSGTATVNLRGLGAERTLVLINGRRLMPGDPTRSPDPGATGAPDLNQIPVALVERVDVLTGGASATYGADAVAGVVNFVMNDHFEGLRIDANAGIYNHSDHEGLIAPLLEAAGDTGGASGDHWDGANKDLTVIFGTNVADNRGNITGYLGYRTASPVSSNQRDYSSCPLSAGPGSWSCGGSGTADPAIIYGGPSSLQVGPTGTLGPVYNRYNYAVTRSFQRPDDRYTGGFFAHYELNNHAEAYSEFSFMSDHSEAQYAPSGAFPGAGKATDPLLDGGPDGNVSINCGNGGFGNSGSNPFLTQNEWTRLCNYAPYDSAHKPAGAVPYSLSPDGLAQIGLGRRNVEGGPRIDDLMHTSFRGVFGIRGNFGNDWKYDVYGQYGTTYYNDQHLNDASTSKVQNALLVVSDPLTGQPVCSANANGAGGAPGCVPYNIWQPGRVTPQQIAYFTVPATESGSTTERVVSGYLSGDLTRVGVKTPWATQGLVAVFGTEYRQEGLVLQPDEEYLTGDLAGVPQVTEAVNGQFHVWEAFTEVRIPIIQDAPGAKSLNFETGYRYSSYSEGFATNTYKFGIEWAPINDVRVRTSWNRAVRAPNIQELYQPPHTVYGDFRSDRCAGPHPSFSLAQCMNTGVTAAEYGNIIASPASEYNGYVGGNPNLKPEVAITKSLGFVITPSALREFQATIDYFDIKISDLIQSYGGTYILNQCATTGQSMWCNLVSRSPSGSLWLSPSANVSDTLLNLGSEETKGIDLGAKYQFGIGRWGGIRMRVDGTYLQHFEVTTTSGAASYDCAGLYGPVCTQPLPKWRHQFTMDWTTPVKGLMAGFTWRHFNSLTLDETVPGNPAFSAEANALPDAHLPSVNYLDLHTSYAWKSVTLRAGVNNVLDKDPPLVGTNEYPGVLGDNNTLNMMYDTLGRYFFVNVSVDF